MYINLFTGILLCSAVNTVLWDMWYTVQTITNVALWDMKVNEMLGRTWMKLLSKLVWEKNGSVFLRQCVEILILPG